MKKTILSKMFIALLMISLASCDVEPVDSVVLDNPGNTDNPGDGNGGGNNSGGEDNGTSEGDYWPMAVGNQWVFNSTGDPVSPMEISATEEIDGTTYYRIDNYFVDAGTNDLTGTGIIYLRKDGGTYYERVTIEVPDNNGMSITVSPYEFIFLKDNLEVNETWTQSVTQTTSYTIAGMEGVIPDIESNIDIEGKILEKGISLTVNGVTYDNVIKERLTQTYNMDVNGETLVTVATTYAWFAKDVGPIKAESEAVGEQTTLTLNSYIVN